MVQVRGEQITTASGHRLHVVRQGTGPPLLMLNGIGGHAAMWEQLATKLGRTHELILLDAPGCGLSPALRVPRRMSGLSVLVQETLDALELNQVDVLGYSWGGALAQQLAHDAPWRIRRLVLASTIPGLGGVPPGPRIVARMLTPTRYHSSQKAHAHARRVYGGEHAAPSTTASRTLEHWDDFPPKLGSYLHQLFAIAGWSSLPWLRKLRPQTLIISGDDDPLVSRLNARLLACLIRTSELSVIPGGGHLWLLDHPDDSFELIERFLAKPPRD